MSRELGNEVFVSLDERRMVLIQPIRCFEGKPTEDGWQGEEIGITYDLVTARKWLDGEDLPVREIEA